MTYSLVTTFRTLEAKPGVTGDFRIEFGAAPFADFIAAAADAGDVGADRLVEPSGEGRVGAAGLSVRNVLSDRLVPWDDVVGVSFPVGARWARIDLPDDEYIPLMAIQSVDKDRAVAAMDTVRSLVARYRPDLPST